MDDFEALDVFAAEEDDFIGLLLGTPKGTEARRSHSGDVLLQCFSGYWLCGVCRNPLGLHGWLVFEDEYGEGRSSPEALDEHAQDRLNEWAHLDEEGREPFKATFEGEGVFYFVDRAVAMRALEYGRKRWGESFTDGTCDYADMDCAVQVALLGKVTYG